MGSLRVEIWDPPGIATFERRIAGIQGMGSLSGTEYRRQVGRGTLTLPADYPRLGEIIAVDPDDTSNMAASTVRVYRNDDLIKEFLVTETPNVISDQPTSVFLQAIEAVMDWAVVEPWDWDGTADFVSSFPDWVWGGRNVLVDPTFAEGQCNPCISEFWTDATSGNWTVNVNGNGPVNVAFNIGALALEAAYQTMVADVLVEGSGANTDPWRVTFVDPCVPTSYVVTDGTLDEPLVQTLIEQGNIGPVGWTESKTLSTGVPITFGDYTTFEVGTPPSPAPSGTNTALHVVGTNNSVFHFPGAQTTPGVTPGGLYQAGVWVYPVGTNQDFRLVVRPIDENPLIATSTWPSVTLTANTWTLVPITDAMIPEGIDRVIFRIAAIEDTADFWITDAYLEEGQAPTTVGDIVGELLDDAQTDHAPGRETLTFIDPTFTDSLDSAGNAWTHSEVRISIPRGMTYRKMLEALLGPLGYEWSVTPSTTLGTWELNVWNPGGRVVDVTAAATPSLLVGQGTLAGYATRQLPAGNRVVAEGEGGYSSRSEDTASQPVIGVREAYRYDPAYMADMVDEWADEILARFVDETYAPRFDIADPAEGSTQPVPMVDYGIAYRLNADLADGSGKVAREVEAVSWRDNDQGLVWTVHTGMAQFDQPTFSSVWANQAQTRSNDQTLPGGGGPVAPPESNPLAPVAGYGVVGPVAEGTRWLLDNFTRQRAMPVASALPPAGGGGMAHILIVADDEPDYVKNKADFVVDHTSLTAFQAALDTDATGDATVWVAGFFEFDGTLGVSGRRLRALGDSWFEAQLGGSLTIEVDTEGLLEGFTYSDVTIDMSGGDCHLVNSRLYGETEVLMSGDAVKVYRATAYGTEGTPALFHVTGADCELDVIQTFGTNHPNGVIFLGVQPE